jgi:peptidoglycan hydrolase-like protein with peptidoglycan-binding domain
MRFPNYTDGAEGVGYALYQNRAIAYQQPLCRWVLISGTGRGYRGSGLTQDMYTFVTSQMVPGMSWWAPSDGPGQGYAAQYYNGLMYFYQKVCPQHAYHGVGYALDPVLQNLRHRWRMPTAVSWARNFSPIGAAPANSIDLSTTAGVQQAYNDLLSVQDDAQSVGGPGITLTGTSAALTGPAVGVDGNFGSDTTHAVIDFQSAFGLSVDGDFGKDTRAAMVQALLDNAPGDAVTGGDSTVVLKEGRAIQPPAPPVPVTPPTPVVVPPVVVTGSTVPPGNAGLILLGVGVVGVLAYGAYKVMKDKRHHHRHLFA